MRTSAKLADQCLWLKHVNDGPVKDALASLHPGSRISLLVDADKIDFERMATGRDGRITDGFKPVGNSAQIWRNRYRDDEHQLIELDFARDVNV